MQKYIISVFIIFLIFISGFIIGRYLFISGTDDDFEEQHKQAQTRVEQLENELRNIRGIIGSLRDENQRAEQLIERFRENERIYEERVTELESNNNRLRKIITGLEHDYNELRERNRANVERAESIERGLEELEEFLRSLEEG